MNCLGYFLFQHLLTLIQPKRVAIVQKITTLFKHFLFFSSDSIPRRLFISKNQLVPLPGSKLNSLKFNKTVVKDSDAAVSQNGRTQSEFFLAFVESIHITTLW